MGNLPRDKSWKVFQECYRAYLADACLYDHETGVNSAASVIREAFVKTPSAEVIQSIIDERSNGALIGTSPAKGGRAWLEGEWCLAELEALCIKLRQEAGANAEGVAEILSGRDAEP